MKACQKGCLPRWTTLSLSAFDSFYFELGTDSTSRSTSLKHLCCTNSCRKRMVHWWPMVNWSYDEAWSYAKLRTVAICHDNLRPRAFWNGSSDSQKLNSVSLAFLNGDNSPNETYKVRTYCSSIAAAAFAQHLGWKKNNRQKWWRFGKTQFGQERWFGTKEVANGTGHVATSHLQIFACLWKCLSRESQVTRPRRCVANKFLVGKERGWVKTPKLDVKCLALNWDVGLWMLNGCFQSLLSPRHLALIGLDGIHNPQIFELGDTFWRASNVISRSCTDLEICLEIMSNRVCTYFEWETTDTHIQTCTMLMFSRSLSPTVATGLCIKLDWCVGDLARVANRLAGEILAVGCWDVVDVQLDVWRCVRFAASNGGDFGHLWSCNCRLW